MRNVIRAQDKVNHIYGKRLICLHIWNTVTSLVLRISHLPTSSMDICSRRHREHFIEKNSLS